MSPSAPLIWTLILLTTWHKSCLNSALSVTGNTPRSLCPQLTLMFCWGDITGHTIHHGAELPGGWASGKCSQMDFKAVTQVLSLSRDWILVEHRLPCVPPHCEHVGVWRRRPCVIHVCKVTTSRGTHHCTSFLSFNFWIFNACVNTGVLSHPMNVCKYAEVYVTASRKQRLFWYYILKQISGCEDF